MKQGLKVVFLTSHNYFDKNAWSGTLYYMHQALMLRDLQLINLGYPYKPYRFQHFFNRKIPSSTKIGSQHDIANCLKFAHGVEKQLQKTPCDVIIALLIETELNFLKTNIPIIKLSDATLKSLKLGYNLKLDAAEIAWKYQQECLSIAKAKKLIYPSRWAANSAIHDYGIKPEKIEVIPFGANLDTAPLFNKVSSKKPSSSCRLLFIGKEWDRKGGEIAFQTLISLCKMGIDAELVVVGTVPPPEFKHKKLTIIPYLNKNYPQQQQQLSELFLKSHFFILPSRAECYGAVLCEANAFGLPAIASEVGGIPTIIKNGINGYTLPSSASGQDYADLIIKTFSNPTCYENLVRSSREEYDKRLNWNKWAENIHQVIKNTLK